MNTSKTQRLRPFYHLRERNHRTEQAELRTLQTVAARKREAGADIINQGMEDGRECLEAERVGPRRI